MLEIGTGAGYGIEVVAPRARSFVTIDKLAPAPEPTQLPNVEFRQATVPPLPFANDSFDFVISFQVIEHIKQDLELVREVKRVLRPGGKFIVTTPNAPMSLTRNPWHIREYTAAELRSLLGSEFSSVEALGVSGNARVMEYYEQNRRSVKRITRFDLLDLQHRLPRCLLQFPYDVLNRINRRRLLKSNTDLTTSIRMDDYRIGPVTDESFDLFFVAENRRNHLIKTKGCPTAGRPLPYPVIPNIHSTLQTAPPKSAAATVNCGATFDKYLKFSRVNNKKSPFSTRFGALIT